MSESTQLANTRDNSANNPSVTIGSGTERRLANLRPPWKPGESGNPRGPRPKPITKALTKLLKHDADKDIRVRTVAEKIALGQIERAIAKDLPSVEFITDRVEGKAESFEAEQSYGPPTVNLVINVPRPERAPSNRAESLAALPPANDTDE